MTAEQYYPQNNPKGDPFVVKKPNKAPLIIVVTLIIILLVSAVVTYALGLWSFNINNKGAEEMFKESFLKSESIDSGIYDFNFSIATTYRDFDTQTLEVSFTDAKELKEVYARDYERFSAIRYALADNRSDFRYNNKYSDKLRSDIKNDPSTDKPFVFYSVGNGSDFVFIVTFETDAAISAIEKQTVVPEIEDKTVFFNKKHVNSYFSFPREPKEPFFVEFLNDQEDILKILPGEFDLSVNFTGKMNKSDDAEISFIGEAMYEDMTAKLGFDVSMIAEKIYARANYIPGVYLMFQDFSKVKGEWIELELPDLNGFYSIYDEELIKESTEITEQLKQFLKVAQDNGLILGSDKANKEKLDGRNVYHYELGLKSEDLGDFYKKITDIAEKDYKNNPLLTFDESTRKYLDAPEMIQLINYFNSNGRLDYYIDRKTGYPVKIAYTLKYAPPLDIGILENRQLVFSIESVMKDINKDVQIIAPKEYITFDEASMKISGQSEDEYYFNKQIGRIGKIRRALSSYYSLIGEYPDQLDYLHLNLDQLKEEKGIVVLPKVPASTSLQYPVYGSSTYSEDRYKSTPFLFDKLEDVYTKEAYGYNNLGKNYTLVYTMENPIYQEGMALRYTIYKTDWTGGKSVKTLKYEDGLNTMTSANLSEETLAGKAKDSDGDLLTDILEDYIGTNKYDRDSDDDGVDDGAEIGKNSNPLGSGYLESNNSWY